MALALEQTNQELQKALVIAAKTHTWTKLIALVRWAKPATPRPHPHTLVWQAPAGHL